MYFKAGCLSQLSPRRHQEVTENEIISGRHHDNVKERRPVSRTMWDLKKGLSFKKPMRGNRWQKIPISQIKIVAMRLLNNKQTNTRFVCVMFIRCYQSIPMCNVINVPIVILTERLCQVSNSLVQKPRFRHTCEEFFLCYVIFLGHNYKFLDDYLLTNINIRLSPPTKRLLRIGKTKVQSLEIESKINKT